MLGTLHYSTLHNQDHSGHLIAQSRHSQASQFGHSRDPQSKMSERRKVSVNILGTKLSFKLPKVRVFKKKCDMKEPEWSWQSVAPPPVKPHYHQHGHRHVHAHGQQRTLDMKQIKHRFLTSEQVNTIHTWLSSLPQPGDIAPLLEDTGDVSILSNSSHLHQSPRHRFNQPAIHTEIF